jgi:copper(I)-binding protein
MNLRNVLACAGTAALVALAAVPASLAQHAHQKAGSLVIETPWTRATPGGAKVAGGFLKITNKGSAPDRLIGGTLPIAADVEVHDMTMTDGIMKMRRLESLEIRPGQTIELKPGSYHVMFMGLKEGLKAGGTITGTLVFEKAGTANVEYKIAPIGASSLSGGPKPSGGHGH